MTASDPLNEHLIAEISDLKKEISHLKAIIDQREAATRLTLYHDDKYKTILDNMEEFYFEVDLAGHFTFFNDQICKVFGYSREELMGMNNRDYTNNEISIRMFNDFNQVFKTGNSFRIADYTIVTKEGASRNLEISVSLLKDQNGCPVGFSGVGRDITDRKQKELDRALLIDQLEQVQRLEAIARLAGGVAHDFNNILMGMQGNISLILLKVDADEITVKRLKKMEELIDRGAHLIQQLLGFANAKVKTVNPININNIIENTSYFFGKGKKNIVVHQDLEKSLWPVDLHRGAMEQILLSIYMNAEQAMPEGGDLFITSRNVFLDDAFVNPFNLQPGRFVHISIKDTGVGMDLATQRKIFEPFFTTKEFGLGNGLGLATVFGIVRNHGGMIKVESEKGRGAVFHIYLAAANHGKEGPEGNGALDDLFPQDRVLLVIDDPLMNDVCESLLTELGYQVVAAKNQSEAYEKFSLNAGKIRMVMIDSSLSERTGDQIISRLQSINPLVPVLLIDGYRENEAFPLVDEKRVYLIQKPFSLSHLSEIIRKIRQANPQ